MAVQKSNARNMISGSTNLQGFTKRSENTENTSFFIFRDQETKDFSNITLIFNFEGFVLQDGFSLENWKDLIFKERNGEN